MRRSRSVPAIVGTVALAVTGVPALAAGPAAAQPTRSVTVYLKPADGALLTRLASTGFTDRSARLAELAKALPSAAAHRAAAAALERRGFAVTGEDAWSVTAKAPASLVSTVFGAVRGLLPRLPAGLGSLATAAVTSGGPRVVRAHSVSGPGFRNAYTSVANTRRGVPAYPGRDRVHQPTIATIQFSGWRRSDLATYARRHHLPYSSSTLTQVPAGQSRVPTASDHGGAIEVALDQEALLSTAPHAHQRAYFAPNTASGLVAAYRRVANDVRGHRSHIVALSTSWGMCETKGPGSRNTINNLLKSISAAGTTVFASSGDDGAYDCTSSGLLGLGPTPTVGVDFPASSPYVVAVGGTRLVTSNRAPYNGRNWSETAWSCSSTSSCTSSGGSGGGVSSVYSGRRVPDIAADAAPATGFPVYSSQEGSGIVGGTSLATPVSAALFTNMLASRGFSHGIGGIRGRIRSAASHAGTFRDIRTGQNGRYAAGAGYDLVTGYGAPLWPAIGDRIFTGKRPKAHVTMKRKHPHARKKRWRRVTVHWRGPRHTRMLTAEVIVRQGNGRAVAYRSGTRPKGSLTFTGKRGRTYTATVQVVNRHHVMSATRTVKVRVPKHRHKRHHRR